MQITLGYKNYPDPISKTTWDNYLTVSPRFAKELGLANEYVSNGALNGDVVDLSVNGTSVRVPVLIQPGQAYKTVGLAVGYGRQGAGKAGDGVGVNAFVLANDSIQQFLVLRSIKLKEKFTSLHVLNFIIL